MWSQICSTPFQSLFKFAERKKRFLFFLFVCLFGGSHSQKKKDTSIPGGDCIVEDLDLDFSLPGRPDWLLKVN